MRGRRGGGWRDTVDEGVIAFVVRFAWLKSRQNCEVKLHIW